jgi:hypothetical protein
VLRLPDPQVRHRAWGSRRSGWNRACLVDAGDCESGRRRAGGGSRSPAGAPDPSEGDHGAEPLGEICRRIGTRARTRACSATGERGIPPAGPDEPHGVAESGAGARLAPPTRLRADDPSSGHRVGVVLLCDLQLHQCQSGHFGGSSTPSERRHPCRRVDRHALSFRDISRPAPVLMTTSETVSGVLTCGEQRSRRTTLAGWRGDRLRRARRMSRVRRRTAGRWSRNPDRPSRGGTSVWWFGRRAGGSGRRSATAGPAGRVEQPGRG